MFTLVAFCGILLAEYAEKENFMATFKNTGRHAQDNPKMKKSTLIVIILAAVLVAAFIFGLTIGLSGGNTNGSKTETEFVEHKPEKVKKDEKITINDPSNGEIEIDAVEGFEKNLYVNENFKLDKNGMMTYYIDGEVASCMGVDLSEYQGEVNFEKLKKQGFEFVMLRIGGRGYGSEGKMYVDTNYHSYYKAAKDAGLKVGGYFFSQAKNAEEGKEEADFVMNSIYGMDFDYPVAFDWELIEGDTARTDDVGPTDLTDAAISFCETLKAEGYEPIIYANIHLMYQKYELERLKSYDFWIADYEDNPSMYYNFTMWQYDIEGQVDGINGNVDMNICMKNY